MRKSAISYYLASHSEVGVAELSIWTGNSEASCRRYYLKILTEEDGARWFSAPNRAFWRCFVERGLGELMAEQETTLSEAEQNEPGTARISGGLTH